jgi:hypothetical protein
MDAFSGYSYALRQVPQLGKSPHLNRTGSNSIGSHCPFRGGRNETYRRIDPVMTGMFKLGRYWIGTRLSSEPAFAESRGADKTLPSWHALIFAVGTGIYTAAVKFPSNA